MELFQEYSDKVINTPDAVKKLREFIITLAIRGKLVPQDPKDEPASELLKRIKAKKISKVEELSHIKKEEIPYNMPDNWIWYRLHDLVEIIMGQSPDGTTYNRTGNGTPFFQGKIEFGKIYPKGVSMWCTNPKRLSRPNDVLISVRAPVGDVNISDKTYAIGRGLTILRSDVNVINHMFLFYSMLSEIGRWERKGAFFDSINRNQIENFLLAIPSLSEQKRIVEKVEQLMILCDELEKHLSDIQLAKRNINSAVQNRLINAGSLEEFKQAVDFVSNHFDLLYSTKEDVSLISNSILAFAMQGKLVPQDPKDEPASELLKRIKAEKAQLIKEKKLKSGKELPPIKPEEIPYPIPDTWTWCRLGDIISISSGNGLTSYQMDNSGKYPVYGGNGINGHHIMYNVSKPTIVIGRVGYYCGCIHLTDQYAWVTDNAFIVSYPENNINRDFLIKLLTWANLGNQQYAGSQPVISGLRVYPKLLPLPPLQEQQRIVEKLNNLMHLCDELKTSIEHSKDLNDRLLKATLREALQD